ncbi:MAG: hypothetical protein MJD61_03775 [Proteobacteria bacterium]|nr:hypothetical protein [Pseudomonadota bacterium]
MAATKVSVTLDETDVKWARALARRRKTSLSAILGQGLAQLRAFSAQERYLGDFKGRLDEQEIARVEKELAE